MLLYPGMENESDTLGAFYISKFPETNAQYVAYLNHLKAYQLDSLYFAALPDTNIWINTDLKSDEKENLRLNYLRGTVFKTYPVLGLSDKQIKAYTVWKTDRLNEYILWREIVFPKHSYGFNLRFSTTEYLNYLDENEIYLFVPELDPAKRIKKKIQIRLVKDILFPEFYLSKNVEMEYVLLFDQIDPKPKYYFKKCPKGKLRTLIGQPTADFFQDHEGIKMNQEVNPILKEMGLLPVKLYPRTKMHFYIVDEVQVGNQKLKVLRLSMPRIGRVQMK